MQMYQSTCQEADIKPKTIHDGWVWTLGNSQWLIPSHSAWHLYTQSII